MNSGVKSHSISGDLSREPGNRSGAVLKTDGASIEAMTSQPLHGNQTPMLHKHLNRLARFGANIFDAHSCAILLPERVLLPGEVSKDLMLAAAYSLCDLLRSRCEIRLGDGLLGWVAQHGQAIHVTPFDQDARTLGVYKMDVPLQSLLVAPIHLATSNENVPLRGAVLCDSRKPNAFSQIEGSLLQDFAVEIAEVVGLSTARAPKEQNSQSWPAFKKEAGALLEALGINAVSLMRLTPKNYREIERTAGMAAAIQLSEQLLRLFKQSLPPHFPLMRLPNGDVVALVDSMMVSFYQGKLEAVMRHVEVKGNSLAFAVTHEPLNNSGMMSEQEFTDQSADEYRRVRA